MTHQSVSKELADLFTNSVTSGNERIIRVSIINESLVPNGTLNVKGSWESDFEEVIKFLDEKIPCYILYRLDTKSSSLGDHEWVDKMLYASTRATLVKDLGDYRFVDSMYGNKIEDFTLEGYQKHKQHQQAEAPLTQREKELAEVRTAEANANSYSSSARKSHAAGVSFPLSDEAIDAIKSLGQSEKSNNIVQLSLDIANERIDLDSANKIEIDDLANSLPSDAPRFSFLAYDHDYKGKDFKSIIFIYTCPSSSKIKERMLYSSCRGSVISFCENEIGLTITKKMETNDPSDLTKSYILEELHPVSDAPVQAFSRPKPPGRSRASVKNN
ncbi:333_t:CDS:10 [Acaulospora morrowiae]|uniref:333_t:CDS:1 n=1 Tax=Acaulospora morrowiae TaxID=94023 RepID=A0A9N9CWL5_9GLOM|nr:333_t:CDS:10 [Acaulospora morrowiae]